MIQIIRTNLNNYFGLFIHTLRFQSFPPSTIGAAGAIESIITIMSIKNNLLTPTINLDHPDPDLDLDYVPNKSRQQEVQVALSISFGFGGHNATLVFREFNK